jgi:hypothetical protein
MPIVNRKKISTIGFDQDALIIKEDSTSLLNLGNLTTTGDLANGIFADANNVTIRNRATIETSGDGAAGIFAHGDNAHIENYGTIITHGGVFGDDEFFSEGIFVLGDRFNIANYGNIRVEGESSSGLIGEGDDGVVVNYGLVESLSDGLVLAAFGNRSQAINAGQVIDSGADTDVMHVSGEGAAALNLGQILITGFNLAGMVGGGENTHITNEGTIVITADGGSFGMGGLGDGHQVSNFGLIETHGFFATGIEALGGGPSEQLGLNLEIVNGGRIVTDGDLAIGVALGLASFGPGFQPAADGQIVNLGMIETEGDGAAGVIMAGDGHQLTNSGLITTDGGAFDSDTLKVVLHAAGVVVSGDDALVENTETGVIRSENADSAAVELNVLKRSGLNNVGTSSQVENSGLIEGANVAILGGDGQETVVNHGSIVGDVILGGGADTFVFGNGGSLDGDLFLGAGKDLVVIENGAGTAEIADFTAGPSNKDVIDVSAFYSSFQQMASNIHQVGNDAVITLDADDQLVLLNTPTRSLSVSDFLFV